MTSAETFAFFSKGYKMTVPFFISFAEDVSRLLVDFKAQAVVDGSLQLFPGLFFFRGP